MAPDLSARSHVHTRCVVSTSSSYVAVLWTESVIIPQGFIAHAAVSTTEHMYGVRDAYQLRHPIQQNIVTISIKHSRAFGLEHTPRAVLPVQLLAVSFLPNLTTNYQP